MKSYNEMLRYSTYDDRLKYLQLDGKVGEETFGPDRYFNQRFYRSQEWKRAKELAVVRDLGSDMALPLHEIGGKIVVHHIEPITLEDIMEASPKLTDLNNLVCVSFATHNAIHYGYAVPPDGGVVNRTQNDTCPWR